MAFMISNQKLGGVIDLTQWEWMKGDMTKICLSVDSEEELLEIHSKAIDIGLVSHLITDNGITEFGGVKTVTCLAIGPDYGDNIDPITKHLKLR